MTPLILATKQKHQEVAKYLVTEGKAKVNVTAIKVKTSRFSGILKLGLF